MKEPNPTVNFDPSCALLIETSPDPEKGASTALTVAVSDGYVPTISWLVTKENGEQAIVVLVVRRSRVGERPALPWTERPASALFAFAVVGLSMLAACAILAAVVG